jgi:hypothetical protein
LSKNLDHYFFVLKHGKHQFDLVTSELQQRYKRHTDWDGLYQLWMDWKGDRWMLRHLLKWMDDLPDWIDKETEDIDMGM